MPEDHSLLSHLVPKLTPQVEDAATDALAYILNMSEQCRKALVDLVSDGDFRLAELDRCRTQVVRDDRSRLDLVGYDADDRMRLIVESKFWAALLRGQASEYVKHLCPDGPAMLLFVAPKVRIETLWGKIERQFCSKKTHDEECTCLHLGQTRNVGPMKVATVCDKDGRNPPGGSAEHRVALMSWGTLLDHLELVDTPMVHNIQQLKVLAHAQDDVAFAPLRGEDFSAAVPQRILDFNRIVDDVVWGQEWMETEGLKAAPQPDGYLRYFRFRSKNGDRTTGDHALCVSCRQWARSGITPLWLRFWRNRRQDIDAIRADGGVEHIWRPGNHMWIPLRLQTGVEYADVLEDVVTKVERVRDIVLPVPAATDR